MGPVRKFFNVIFGLGFLAAAIYIIVGLAQSGPSTPPSVVAAPSSPATAQSPKNSKWQATVKEAAAYLKNLNGDVIKEINLKDSYARIHPIVWGAMDLKMKQNIVTSLAICCGANHSLQTPVDVEVRSTLNDKVLGEYGMFSGVRIVE